MNGSFWRGKRVFLTGHTGFKGSWLSLWLTRMGASVVGYALAPDHVPSLFEVAEVGNVVESHIGDVRDGEALAGALIATRPDIVFHMAAQPLVRSSYADPVGTYATNVMGTVHLLEAVRRVDSVGAVVIVTSDKCYENREWVWAYRESDAPGGYDPYSNSKGCSELVASAYRRSFFAAGGTGNHPARIGSGRAGNVIGGGDWSVDRLIPDMVRAAVEGKAVEIRYPDAIRPWQHVLEPLSGYLALAERLWTDEAAADGWNFGPEMASERPVAEVVSRVCELWGDTARWLHVGGEKLHEATYLRLDSGKARLRLGWQPRWNLDQALQATVSWYRAYYDGADMRALCNDQIAAYCAAGQHSEERSHA